MKIYDRMLKINKLRAFWSSFQGVRFSFLPFFVFFVIWMAAFAMTGCRDTSKDSQPESAMVKCSESVQFESVESDYFSIGKLCGVDVAVVRSVVGKDTLVHKYVMMDSAAAALGTDLQRRGSQRSGFRRLYCVCRSIVWQPFRLRRSATCSGSGSVITLSASRTGSTSWIAFCMNVQRINL